MTKPEALAYFDAHYSSEWGSLPRDEARMRFAAAFDVLADDPFKAAAIITAHSTASAAPVGAMLAKLVKANNIPRAVKLMLSILPLPQTRYDVAKVMLRLALRMLGFAFGVVVVLTILRIWGVI